jgi:hypothetical protein
VSCGRRTVHMSTASNFQRPPPRTSPPSLAPTPLLSSTTFTNFAGESSWHAMCRLESHECQGNEIVALC